MKKYLPILILITACSTAVDDYPVPDGAGYKSVSEISEEVIQNNIGEDEFLKSHVTQSTIKIWLRGYKTPEGNVVEDSYAYVNLKKKNTETA